MTRPADLHITVNGETRAASPGTTVAALISALGMDPERIAIERNEEVIPRLTWREATVADGDRLEIVAFIGGGSGADVQDDDPLVIAGRSFRSRLLVGTGKYRSIAEGREAIRRSGADIVTVALRRVELTPGKPNVLDTIDRARHAILPNTAGCYTAEEAIRTCRLARELGMSDMIKLEVIGDPQTLFPDGEATLQAATVLVKEGFVVLPYCLDDPILARKLEDVGCAAIMPLAAPIGSGLGIRNPYNISIILERAKVPIIVDAGVGTASDAAIAMELGCHGVLMNTAIAEAKHPVLMAEAMRDAVVAGRKAFRAGRIPRRLYANASSPVAGMIE
jgi:thiazole synthase